MVGGVSALTDQWIGGEGVAKVFAKKYQGLECRRLLFPDSRKEPEVSYQFRHRLPLQLLRQRPPSVPV